MSLIEAWPSSNGFKLISQPNSENTNGSRANRNAQATTNKSAPAKITFLWENALIASIAAQNGSAASKINTIVHRPVMMYLGLNEAKSLTPSATRYWFEINTPKAYETASTSAAALVIFSAISNRDCS